MKKALCYKKDDLLALLPGFQIMKIKTFDESEDDSADCQRYYITNRSDIEYIHNYHSFGTSTSVKFQDNSKTHLYGKNAKPNKKHLSFAENDFISPPIAQNAEYIEVTNVLISWLKFNGVTEEALEQITDSYTVYQLIEYPGISNPIGYVKGRYWEYSSEPLVLDEREIQTVLNSIEDELLRKKIECILYEPNIFKRRY